MPERLAIWVPGIPVSQGSMRSPKAGIVLHNNAKLTGWREAISWAAKDVWRGKPLIDGPASLELTFVLPKPKKPRNKDHPDATLDLDKLIRAVCDALQGVVIKNDSRFCWISAEKLWPSDELGDLYPSPGVEIMVYEW